MLGTAAQTETGCFELDLGQVETGLPAGVADTAPDGALKPGAAFCTGGVVARAGLSSPENPAGFVTDDGRRPGLAAVDSKEKFHGSW